MAKTKCAPKAVRIEVFERDGYICHYCCCDVLPEPWADVNAQNRATVDHIIAVADGGAHDLDNLVTCCRWCNALKADIPYAVFIAVRGQLTRERYLNFMTKVNLHAAWTKHKRAIGRVA